MLLYRGIKIALKQERLFSKYLAFGLTFQIIFQTFLNLMVVIGLIPVTGVTLPFFSYGGSSLVMIMAQMGVILSVSRQARQKAKLTTIPKEAK